MIVFAGITPHSPLLLESINKDQLEKVEKTRTAMRELADELYATHPDVIVILSEHPTSFPATFSINLSDPYKFDLKQFGDLGFDKKFRPAIMLIDRLQRSLRKNNQPVTLSSDAALNFAAAVPLSFLADKLPNVRLVPITYSEGTAKEHFQFGDALKDALLNAPERIAIIAAGDMSHALTSSSPAGFNKAGEFFDNMLQGLISANNSAGLLNLDPETVKDANETLYRPLLILLGVMERISTNTHILSYESPFGVGYLVANLILQ